MSEVTLYYPKDLGGEEWRQLQGIERDALSSTLARRQEEIDALVKWDDPVQFMNSHINPNTEVGERHIIPNQAYTYPLVAVASEHGEPIGFAYSAHNVSGSSPFVRAAKRLSVVRNYLWIGGIAVKPEHQGQDVEKDLGRTLLRGAMSLQPVATYVWPNEHKDAGFMGATLEQLGFASTGAREVFAFGEDNSPVKEVRWQAQSVSVVLRNLG